VFKPVRQIGEIEDLRTHSPRPALRPLTLDILATPPVIAVRPLLACLRRLDWPRPRGWSVGKFWYWCDITGLLSCSRQLLNKEKPTRVTVETFDANPGEVMRQWRWIQYFGKEPYSPRTGDEIGMYADGRPYNGTHRASALHALGRRVPAIIVELDEDK